MNGIRTLQFDFKYLSLVLQDFGDTASTFTRKFFEDMNKLEKNLIAEKLHENDCKTGLTALMKTQESKIDMSKALDAGLVVVERCDFRPVYDEEPMAEVQLTTECNIFATRQQQTEQPEFNNE
ncbi:hypothetical protein Tco_0513368 [Tanacetum coccineum]